ncbi:MAG: hypothetical protein ABJF23_11220 [Bryobacteraceae bacterium]
MPLQNRVSPSGQLFSSPARGTLMGNRGGVLHNEQREIIRQYKSRSWITCQLEFKGRRRKVMTPGLYTELFFLDEATALAAGHRPCAECRRERFNAFKAAWRGWSVRNESTPLLVGEMDVQLHRLRIGSSREKITYQSAIDSLPDGCLIRFGGGDYLVQGRRLLLWSPDGYVKWTDRHRRDRVTVLTPRPIVACLSQGYVAGVHASAFSADLPKL